LEIKAILNRPKIEKFLNNHSSASKKIYKYCVNLNIKIIFTKKYAGRSIYLSPKRQYIFLNKNLFSKKISANGLLELIITHEIGHLVLNRHKASFFCNKKNINCSIWEEKTAWEKAMKIFSELEIKIDQDLFWQKAAFPFATHLFIFTKENCDEIIKADCPLLIIFLNSPIIKKVANFSKEEQQIVLTMITNYNYIFTPPFNFIIE